MLGGLQLHPIDSATIGPMKMAIAAAVILTALGLFFQKPLHALGKRLRTTDAACEKRVARKHPGMFEAGGIPGPLQAVRADYLESTALHPARDTSASGKARYPMQRATRPARMDSGALQQSFRDTADRRQQSRRQPPPSLPSDNISSMIDWSSCQAVERDPERVSGAWVFRGSRVPVAALFENLEDGAPVAQFVEWFPGVTLEQVRAVLEHAARSALIPA